MTYVERGRPIGRYDAAPAQERERGGVIRTALAILTWPLRAWRNRRDLKEIEGLGPEQLRDIGLTPADVEVARSAPFHASAAIMLAELAEERRRHAVYASDRNATDAARNTPARQENDQ